MHYAIARPDLHGEAEYVSRRGHRFAKYRGVEVQVPKWTVDPQLVRRFATRRDAEKFRVGWHADFEAENLWIYLSENHPESSLLPRVKAMAHSMVVPVPAEGPVPSSLPPRLFV
jgi:hypothetical protein